MADVKISALPASTTPLAGTEVLPIVQGTSTVKVSVTNLTAGRSVSMANATLSTGDLVIGTSGKGVDFSAVNNSGATNQILKNYAEGTWTPTVTSQTGTITTVGATSCTYTRVGKQVTVTVNVVITTNGTGATSVNVTLPFTAAAQYQYGIGQEIAQTGKRLYSTITSGTNNYMAIVNVDGSYPALNGAQLTISMTYQAA